MRKLALLHFLGTPRIGLEFSSLEFPLHLTIIPPFDYEDKHDPDLDILIDGIERLLENQREIKTTVTGRGTFGEENNIPAAILWRSDKLYALHTLLLDFLKKRHVQFDAGRYIHGLYNPHVSDQRGQRINVYDDVPINTISLIDVQYQRIAGRKKVVANFNFQKVNKPT